MLTSFNTPGRVSHVRQIEGQRWDEVPAHSRLSLYFLIFLPFTFLFFSLLTSPISVIFSFIYNLFALLGRKAPFTHSFLLILQIEQVRFSYGIEFGLCHRPTSTHRRWENNLNLFFVNQLDRDIACTRKILDKIM